MNLLVLALLWSFYCFMHSLLIAPKISALLKRKMNNLAKYYRLTYNILSIILLIPICIYILLLRKEPLVIWNGIFMILQILLIAIALFIAYLGAKEYDMHVFLGLKQISKNTEQKIIRNTGKISKNGILGLIRHPFYTSGFILLWARNLDITDIVTNTILTTYLIIGTYLEERKLINEHGDGYIKYKKDVSMFFPIKWFRKRFKI